MCIIIKVNSNRWLKIWILFGLPTPVCLTKTIYMSFSNFLVKIYLVCNIYSYFWWGPAIVEFFWQVSCSRVFCFLLELFKSCINFLLDPWQLIKTDIYNLTNYWKQQIKEVKLVVKYWKILYSAILERW